MTNKFNKLFEPIMIGKVKVKNRIAMAPMVMMDLLNPNGSLNQNGVDYYVERAKGGVGLVITGFFKVENDIESFTRGIPLISRAALPSFIELSNKAHAFGSKVFVQLTAGLGRVANPLRLRKQPVSVSAVSNYWDPDKICKGLKTEEIKHLVKCFGDAAEILVTADIDGIELHGHEGYLFDQFTTAIWNRRTDEYGGDLAARLRFPVEVLYEIKRRVGQDFPVQYRYGLKHYMKDLNSGALPGENFIEAGRDIEEGLQMAKMLENVGFDALHIDAGCYESGYWSHPPIYQKHGCMINMVAEAKKFVKIPVIGVGKLEIPELAEQVITEGKADIVAIGRGLIADAFLVKKIEEGRPERIRPCIGCHGCIGRKPLSCTVNPAAGKEGVYRIERINKPKRVMVVGSGVAGLEAARVASYNGHKVILYEKTDSIGGHLIEASVPGFKKDLARLLNWYKAELQSLDLEIKFGVEVDQEIIRQEKPDIVIIATGSKPIIPDIHGIEKDSIVTAIDILLGKKKTQKEVLVLGGGLIGCEIALWLAQQNKKVTIMDMSDDLMTTGLPVHCINRLMLLDLLKFHNVNVLTNAFLSEITENGISLIDKASRRKNINADTIVLAMGLRPNRELYGTLKDKTRHLFIIGDAKKAQGIMSSIRDAHETVCTI